MKDVTTAAEFDIRDYLRLDQMPHFLCPGCGHGIALRALLWAVHDLGLAHALQAARHMGRPLRGTLLGVEPGRIEPFTTGLSPAVAAALPALQAAALREAELLLARG